MKKIIGIIHPFDLYQILYVYQDGNKLEARKVKTGDIPETIFELSQLYDIYQIDLTGAKHYNLGIIKQIQEKELLRYNKNKLTIKCI